MRKLLKKLQTKSSKRDEQQSVVPRPSTINLCQSCQEVKLTTSDFEDLSEPPRLLLERTLSDLKSRHTCSLCSLIVQVVEQTRSEWQPAGGCADNQVICQARLMNYGYPTARPFRVISVTTNFPFYGPSYGMQLVPVSTHASQKILSGRLVDPREPPWQLIRSWITTCETSHAYPCGISTQRELEDIAQDLLMINVQENRVVAAALPRNYVALSYVWGHVKNFQLLLANRASLMEPDGLERVRTHLPQVIRDSIELTKRLGKVYLWVDSLCIVQDDPVSKTRVIDHMDLIYKHSCLTIIAATGENASSALFGPQQHDRARLQASAHISADLDLIHPRSHLDLERSVWATRGWTFQEYFFARRRLIVLNGVAFFKCRESSWREDLNLEAFGADIDQFNLKKGFQAAQRLWEPDPEDEHIVELHAAYQKHVQAYMSRNLGFDGDVFNAFAGIMNSITTKDWRDSIFYGLWKNMLYNDIFWLPETFLERREQFPTWSWTGWKGNIVTSPIDMVTLAQSSIVIWYEWNPDTNSYVLLREDDTFDFETPPDVPLGEAHIAAFHTLADVCEEWEQAGQSENDRLKLLAEGSETRNCIEFLKYLPYAGLNTLPRTRAPLPTQGSIGPGTLLFRALLGEVWISARAPNGELAQATAQQHLHKTLRPALYMYSSIEPEMEYLGLTWINSKGNFEQIHNQTVALAPGIKYEDIKTDELCQPLFAISRRTGEPSEPTPANRAEMEKIFERIEVAPDRTTWMMPENEQLRTQLQAAKKAAKFKVALLSGPVNGLAQVRPGVPMSFPYTSLRGFHRVLVLRSREVDERGGGSLCNVYERVGIGEVELSALFPKMRYEDIVLC